jgi:hypothetical protein
MLLTLFHMLLVAWIAGVIHFFNIGLWNWLLLAAAIIPLAIRGVLGRHRPHRPA